MDRKLQIQYAGAIFQVMNRGNYQETIFGEDEDRKLFAAASWIAQRLAMGTRGLLARLRYRDAQPPLSRHSPASPA
jgi:hypothetical protein